MAGLFVSQDELRQFLGDLTIAVSSAETCAHKVFVSNLNLASAREDLDTKLSAAIDNGTINGSNQEKREAQARGLFSVEYRARGEALIAVKTAEYEMDACIRRLEHMRMILRVYELAENMAHVTTIAAVRA